MKLSQLRYYEVICKYSNITRASEELHVSQPSLSGVINDLEKEFGVTLFHRQRNGLRMTPEGKRLMELATGLTNHADAVTAEMIELGHKNNVIRLGLPPMVGSIVFPRIFQAMREKYAGVNLEITEAGSLACVSLVVDGKLDAAIVSGGQELPGVLDNVDICAIPIRFYTSIENRLAALQEIDAGSIGDAPLVLLPESSPVNQTVRKAYERLGKKPNIILQTNQLTMIRNLLDNNSASTFLYEGILDPGEENIVGIALPADPSTRVRLIWHKNHQQSNGLRNMIRMLKTEKLFP